MNPIDPKSADAAQDAIEAAAADWLVRRQSGLSVREISELKTWLDADVRHAAAFARLAAAWRVLDGPRTSGHARDLGLELAARQRRRSSGRRTRFVLAGAGLVAAALVFTFVTWRRSTPETIATTVTVRPDRQVLPDGSIVELNAGARLAMAFTPAQRDVRLISGEALFSVVKDPARPFVVTAGDITVRAVGTAFTVRHTEGQVDVMVTEGRVAVIRTSDAGLSPSPTEMSVPPTVSYLDAGAKLVVPAGLPAGAPLVGETISPQTVTAELAWREMRVELSGTPLEEAVARFNRHNRIQLLVTTPALARHQLSGIFWADDPEGFARLLETGMSVTTERVGDTIHLRTGPTPPPGK